VSSARKPVPACTVAVTASIRLDGDTSRVRLTAAYVTALERAGLVPLIVPPLSSTDAAAAVLDSEAALIEEARARGTPVLAICRGIQILNVALGGTLVQDIPSQCQTTIDHDDEGARNSRTHEVAIEPGSIIAKAIGTDHLSVNSFHHQSVKRVADGMRVTARSPDGVIEGIESTDDDWWVMAVQWHPEEMTDSAEPWDRGLFKAFAKQIDA